MFSAWPSGLLLLTTLATCACNAFKYWLPGWCGAVGYCVKLQCSFHTSSAVLQYSVQCDGSSECADFTLVQHSLWVTVWACIILAIAPSTTGLHRTTDWAAHLHWQQWDIAVCAAMQQLQQISLLGQQVAFYALLLDITAKAAKATKVQQQKQLGIQQQQQLEEKSIAVANIVWISNVILH